MDPPFFSVVVPTYNHEAYLPEALESLIRQSHMDWEAIVVDDGSTDGSGKVMDRYAERDSRIRPIHKANGGVASALNAGIAGARGEWICWLSSDDFFEPEKLRVHQQHIKRHPESKFFFTDFYEFDERTRRRSSRFWMPPLPIHRVVRFFSGNYINGISIAIHRSVFREVGLFDERFRNGQDADMWLRICARHRPRFIRRRTCITRLHPGQGTSHFSRAGIYDTAMSCAELLNSHTFAEFFPAVDLNRPTAALRAFVKTMRIALSPESVMYACGDNPSLLRRFREWWGKEHPLTVRIVLGLILRTRFWRFCSRCLGESVRREFEMLARWEPEAIGYERYDILAGAREHVRKLELSGSEEESGALSRYLERFCNR
jgi:glycosyltransferase involved in cell wall biosynthesis